ncbi:MAG: DUF4430 domain-containing protein [Clostridiales bacterium]|jgi:hypothetical protein|nr:DUF4430 domain-containing protein [Clostridiales bacterium]
MSKEVKYFVKVFLTTLGLFGVSVLLLFLFFNRTNPATKGDKEITILVVIPDEEDKEFKFSTDAITLRQALDEQKLINGKESQYGYFITEVDGIKVDDKKSEWWSITKNGEYIEYGVSMINIQDKDQYELTLMRGID